MSLALSIAVANVGGGSPFSVLQLPGLSSGFWIRGDAVSLDGSNNIQTATDKSGNGINFTQATPGARPAPIATDAALGNQPSITIGSGLSIANTGFTIAQPFTMLAVAHIAADNQECVGGATSRADIGRNVGGFYMFAGTIQNITGGLDDANGHAFAYVANGASSKFYVDNSAAPTTANAGAQALTGPTITVFPGSTPGGATAEWIVVAGVLSQTLIAQTFAYFGARYSKAWG
jgi:hypothetical protein